ncbi:MAG: hypothetical protein HY368_03135 [Candidatus Aenigmarchaeota archaeon]|nr:hypothetical protein [Candidatus Aenigmarchaeota archaeon]
MPAPKGFEELVALAAKDRPAQAKTLEEMWEKFLFVVFMGGKRSEPEIHFIIGMLASRGLVGLQDVLKKSGEDWREEAGALVTERLQRIKDPEIAAMLKEFRKDLFRTSSSIKGAARFFEKLSPEKFSAELGTKERTWEFIESLAKNEDVANIKYTKIIIWLHSIGLGYDFCPPSWHTKKFINSEVGPYYQFYEDDMYFMRKAGEFAEEVKKKVKGAATRDVAMAIYYYMSLKNSLPPRSAIKKKCTPAAIVKFLRKRKLSLAGLSAALGDFEGREGIMEQFNEFMEK